MKSLEKTLFVSYLNWFEEVLDKRILIDFYYLSAVLKLDIETILIVISKRFNEKNKIISNEIRNSKQRHPFKFDQTKRDETDEKDWHKMDD